MGLQSAPLRRGARRDTPVLRDRGCRRRPAPRRARHRGLAHRAAAVTEARRRHRRRARELRDALPA
ncbi:hypothetical protein QJS66_18465 [Kocuria rhizophila]|nr:hypothetical protein QJS66_18465 [Kocuria rhizophila]